MWVWELISWRCFILDHFVPFRWPFHVFDVSVWVMSPSSQFLNRFNVSSRESCVVSIHMRLFIWTFQSICKILPTSLIILKYLLRCYIVNYTVFYWSFVKRKLYETKSLEMFFIRHGRLKFTAYTWSPCIFHEWTKMHWILQFIEYILWPNIYTRRVRTLRVNVSSSSSHITARTDLLSNR